MKIHNRNELNSNTLDNLFEGFQLISYEWKYLYVNHIVIIHSRYPNAEDLLGFTMMEKYPGIENTEIFKILQECMNKRTSTNFVNVFTYPDGKKGWFELRVEPVPDGIFILSIDITERKNAEAERKKYINGLEEMLFMTSHRLRQPIVQILGFSNLLDFDSLNSVEDIHKISSYMKQSAVSLDVFSKDLTRLIEGLHKESHITSN